MKPTPFVTGTFLQELLVTDLKPKNNHKDGFKAITHFSHDFAVFKVTRQMLPTYIEWLKSQLAAVKLLNPVKLS